MQELPIRLGFGQFNELNEERLNFIKQVGVDDVIIHYPRLPGDKRWEYEDILNLRKQVESAGLRMGAIENVPTHFYDKIMLGLPGREEQLENMKWTIHNMGKAGVPIFGYHWMPNSVWRTEPEPVRGGAMATAFDYEIAKQRPLTHERVYTEDEMWDNYTYFIKAVVPVAEESGIKLGIHPDDPPVESLGGIARIFRNFENFKRAMEIVDSPCNALEFCQGTWAEMGEDVYSVIRYFGGDKILYVHFRNVIGSVPKFKESFINEGDVDMYKAVKVYKEVGFKGILIPDHVPHMTMDVLWSYIGRSFAIGYMSALLQVVNSDQ